MKRFLIGIAIIYGLAALAVFAILMLGPTS